MKGNYIINKSPDFWKKKLTSEQFNVLVKGGTEGACHNRYEYHQEKGLYVCAACNNVLFDADQKYKSGSGWPSFYDVIDNKAVGKREDHSLEMVRTEIYCNRCGGHLGHMFEDGPEPTGLRYCINSASLLFLKRAYFAMGCFWKPDALFGSLKGVYFTEVGYAGGESLNPTYRNPGNHAETVQVTYDPEHICYNELLSEFWKNHNPTREAYSNQYRSIIFYIDDRQKDMANQFLEEKEKVLENRVYTEIKPVENFTSAEDYHQKYLLKRESELYRSLRSMFNDEKEFISSRIITQLNAYCAGFLEKKEAIGELRNSYKYVDYEEEIEEIISNCF